MEPVLPSVLPNGGSAPVERPAAQGPIRRTEEKPAPLTGENPGKFVITRETGAGTGTTGEKIARNIEAIKTLKVLQAERRYPAAEEQAIIARYVGWGGLKSVFDTLKTAKTDMYGRAQAQLREILTPQEYAAALDSAKVQHRLRRSVCSSWRNKAWHGRLMAFMELLAGESPYVSLRVGASEDVLVDAMPIQAISPVSARQLNKLGEDGEEIDVTTLAGAFEEPEEDADE